MVLPCQQSEAHSSSCLCGYQIHSLEPVDALISWHTQGHTQDVGNSTYVHKDDPVVFLWEALDVRPLCGCSLCSQSYVNC